MQSLLQVGHCTDVGKTPCERKKAMLASLFSKQVWKILPITRGQPSHRGDKGKLGGREREGSSVLDAMSLADRNQKNERMALIGWGSLIVSRKISRTSDGCREGGVGVMDDGSLGAVSQAKKVNICKKIVSRLLFVCDGWLFRINCSTHWEKYIGSNKINGGHYGPQPDKYLFFFSPPHPSTFSSISPSTFHLYLSFTYLKFPPSFFHLPSTFDYRNSTPS